MQLNQADFEHLLQLRTGMVKLNQLSETHLAELAHLAPTMRALWEALEANAASAPPSLSVQADHPLSLTA
ncbi:MAG: hypothetical protein WCD11_14195 [Solirubrobacteraceae bacterium]